MEDPWALLRRLKLGREEYCQRLLTMLILEREYPRWNTRSTPSARGLQFLRDLDALSFGSAGFEDDVVFVDELELPSRDGIEPGCAPDYAVVSPSRLWVIELKTEAASHRADQVPSYFAYARRHYPPHQIDLTYVSPPYRGAPVSAPDGSRGCHLTWDDVLPLVERRWGNTGGDLARLVEALVQALEGSEKTWTDWRTGRTEDPLSTGAELARRTEGDGRQRAVDHPFSSLEEMEEVKILLREDLADAGSNVRPWTWRADSSGGEALTATGAEHGYELRVSRYDNP